MELLEIRLKAFRLWLNLFFTYAEFRQLTWQITWQRILIKYLTIKLSIRIFVISKLTGQSIHDINKRLDNK
jgi:hypothetical protein